MTKQELITEFAWYPEKFELNILGSGWSFYRKSHYSAYWIHKSGLIIHSTSNTWVAKNASQKSGVNNGPS